MDLQVGDVDLEAGVLRARGKGSKERIVPIGREAVRALRHYLSKARPRLVGARAPDIDLAGVDRVAQELATRAKHDRKLFGRNFETFDQRPGAAVCRRIEVAVGVTVAPQEIDEAEDVAVRLIADDDRPGTGFDQADPAQDQGAHDAFANVGLGDEQRAEAVRRDDHGLNVRQRIDVNQRRTARQLRELSHEGAATVDRDMCAFPAVTRTRYLQLA